MSEKYSSPIKVAVLGAGVMGSQIAAELANAGLQVALLDLAATEGDSNSNVKAACQRLLKIKPAPVMLPCIVDTIRVGNYDENLEWLKDYDLIIEAIAERLDLKEQLYKKIAPHLNDHAILASNTSGLSINELVKSLPEALRSRFCGIHYFNPPRYMHLVELIPSEHTAPHLLDTLESFLVTHQGKGVIRAKDTPNFVANRIGVFALLNIFYYTEQLALGFDAVDAVTGPLIGHPKSATYRTSDVVGLDVLAHVIKTMTDGLKSDPWFALFKIPSWLQALIAQGALGQKTGAGVYRKQGKEILVLDTKTQEYRAVDTTVASEVKDILSIKNPTEKMEKLRRCEHPQAKLLWNNFRDVFHYCAFHADSIAQTTRDIDLAMRWGFGWEQGPFELWQACDWKKVVGWIEEDIKQGLSFVKAPLPQWVKEVSDVYTDSGAYNFSTKKLQPWSNLPVYERQTKISKTIGQKVSLGETISENEDLRLWHMQDGIAIATFKTKNHIITASIMEGITNAIGHLEENYEGLVIWQGDSPNFCYGADLKNFSMHYAHDPVGLRQLVAMFQRMVLSLKYAKIPVISAISGICLGGGVEICLHSDKIVAAAETYMGLVEAGVGILPAGGGSKEMALRAANLAQGCDPFPKLKQFFEQIAMAKVSSSALEARQFHYLRETDVIVMNAHEILYVAKACVRELNAVGYLPPVPPRIRVTGRPGIATLQAILVNLKEGHFISEYDEFLATKIATVLCGGNVDANSIMDEASMLALELNEFVALVGQQKTLDRIAYTLKTGKPLRN